MRKNFFVCLVLAISFNVYAMGEKDGDCKDGWEIVEKTVPSTTTVATQTSPITHVQEVIRVTNASTQTINETDLLSTFLSCFFVPYYNDDNNDQNKNKKNE